jgi:tryptophan-rich sensory protein
MAQTALVNYFEFLFVYSLPLAFCSMFLAAYGMVFAGRRRSLMLYYKVAPDRWAPAPWVYGIAWLVAYSLAACAFWVARTGDPAREINDSNVTWAVISHVCTLFALAIWPWLFFYLRHIFLAFVCVCVALGGAISTCVAFYLIDDLAGGLYTFVPLWIAYAVLLNLYVVNYYTIVPKRRQRNGIWYTTYTVKEKEAGAALLPLRGEAVDAMRNVGGVLVVGKSADGAIDLTSDDEADVPTSGEESD